MFQRILSDTGNKKRIFENVVKDNFGKSIKEELFCEVENKIENMQDAYEISEIQSSSIRVKLVELRAII